MGQKLIFVPLPFCVRHFFKNNLWLDLFESLAMYDRKPIMEIEVFILNKILASLQYKLLFIYQNDY